METDQITAASLGTEAKASKSSSNKSFMGIATIMGISGVSAIAAGVITSRAAKRKSAELLKELGKEQVTPVVPVNPYSLAFRALAWGTVWAVGGCSLIVFGLWKWYGFKDLEDLRTRARKHMKKSSNSEGRTEFENLTDFFNYLDELSKAESKAKDSKTS